MRLWWIAAAALSLSACGNDELVKGSTSLFRHVEGNKVGKNSDQWIEMKNMSAEWERVGLIFGYTDDYAECAKAVDGLRRANEFLDYRCVPAN